MSTRPATIPQHAMFAEIRLRSLSVRKHVNQERHLYTRLNFKLN